jgi:predicted alpha/beta superfamily hydrolase
MLTTVFILGCEVKSPGDRSPGNDELSIHFNQYSQSVKDTFYIDVQLPSNYFEDTQRRYPLVIVLDGNFHFPMMESITKQYAIAGLLDQRIVVEVGYKSFIEMDSLRVRDYLFPKPLPSDELTAGGGSELLQLPDI